MTAIVDGPLQASALWSMLLWAAPAVPAILAAVWPIRALRGWALRLAPLAAVPALMLAVGYHLAGPPDIRVSLLALFTGVRLGVDGLGATFLLLTSLLWVACGIFARRYHRDDPDRERFFGYFLLTLAGNVGLVVAGDVLTFYLFFAVMTFAAYGLVVHTATRAAFRAGRIYIAMAVLGELALLAALLSLGRAGEGAPGFGGEMDTVWRLLAERGELEGVTLLLLLGFGVKAGLAPLHLWLPLAHPVAPTAASALLSGAMIKAGLLAWLRFLPTELSLPVLGGGLLVVGIATALYGVIVGVTQEDPKTVLAYSSVSQMGYMAVGIAVFLLNPDLAPLAVAAVAVYALHHGVAKASLFLSVTVVGKAVPSVPGRPSGRWPPALAAGVLLPALALAGAPFTSGAAAKLMLKEGLGELGGRWYEGVDPLLLLAAAGTTMLMARFVVTLAASEGVPTPGERPSRGVPPGLLLPWVGLVALSGMGGLLFPNLVPGGPEAPPFSPLFPGAWEAAWPVVVGGLLAFWIWRRPAHAGSLSALRIPPGDLLGLLRWVAGRRPPPGAFDLERVDRAARSGVARFDDAAARGGGWGAELDPRLSRGTRLGVLVLAIGAALLTALLLQAGG